MYCGKKQIAAPRKRRKRANGTGTVYKMGGKREKNPWAAQKSGVWIGSYPTREAATKALERLTDREITDEYNLTFSQIYERWQPEHSRKTGVSQAELARRISTTPSNLNQKIKRNTLTREELSEIATALGAEFVFHFRFPDGQEI